MHTARTHESRYWPKFPIARLQKHMHVAFLPMIVQILHAGRARNIASCCANKNALCQSSSTSYDIPNKLVCWRAMQHSELAAGLSFGSVLCRCLLLFRCSNLPWKHKHARAWIAALSMRGDVSAQDSAWPPKPVKMMFFLVCDSPAIAINTCLSVYNCIEAILNHEHQWQQKTIATSDVDNHVDEDI